MSIAQFPRFSRLSISSKGLVESITSRFEPYSDFNFASLFSWDDGTTELSILNDNLVIKLVDYISGQPVYSILGSNKIDESLELLLPLAKELKLVPEVTIENLRNNGHFEIREDRDNFDYIYNLDLLAHLPGGGLKKKRNKVSGFQKAFDTQALFVSTKLLRAEDAPSIDRIFVEWTKLPYKSIEEVQPEHKALSRLVQYSDAFKLYLTEVLIDSSLVAFSINEQVSPRYAVCHFEKALPAHQDKNIYTYLSNQVAKELASLGCSLVNWEQDLGLPGLRKSKLSYNPSGFLKKYSIKQQTG